MTHRFMCKCGLYAYESEWEDLPDELVELWNKADREGHTEEECPEKENP